MRAVVLESVPVGYEESMQYGMIGCGVLLSRCPKTYDGAPLNYAALASQKNHMSVGLMGCYGDDSFKRWFEAEFRTSGKKLDMGRSCVGFKKLDDLPLGLVVKAFARMSVDNVIALCERSREGRTRK